MSIQHFPFHVNLVYILAARIQGKRKVFFKVYIYLPTQEICQIKQYCTCVKITGFYFLLQEDKTLFQAVLQVIVSTPYLPLTDVLSCGSS